MMGLLLFLSIRTIGECLALAVIEDGMEKGLVESLKVLEQPGRTQVFLTESLHECPEPFSFVADSLPTKVFYILKIRNTINLITI